MSDLPGCASRSPLSGYEQLPRGSEYATVFPVTGQAYRFRHTGAVLFTAGVTVFLFVFFTLTFRLAL